MDRKAGFRRKVYVGRQPPHFVFPNQFRIGAGLQHRVSESRKTFHLRVRMGKKQCSPLTKHNVEVQLLTQGLPELDGEVVEPTVGNVQVIRANIGGVAPGVAAANPSLLQDGKH